MQPDRIDVSHQGLFDDLKGFRNHREKLRRAYYRNPRCGVKPNLSGFLDLKKDFINNSYAIELNKNNLKLFPGLFGKRATAPIHFY
jgi:hypothetical protein